MNYIKRMFRTHKAEITFTPNPKASLERRARRAARVKISLAKAVARGDVRAAAMRQEELDSLMNEMLAERAQLEQLLKDV